MNLSETKTGWIKFGKIKDLSFVGRDFICVGSGCHMLFINLVNNKEFLYHADNKEVGEGVRAITGHKTLACFAFAEKCRYPKVLVMTCPSFNRVCVLDKKTNEDYLSMTFSEGEYIITLNDTPSFEIIVWNWRTGEIIASLNTNLYGRFQILKANLSVPIYCAQLQTGHEKLILWEIAICGKKCVLTPQRIEHSVLSNVYSDTLWTPEGELFVLDLSGNVYTLETENNLAKVIEWNENGKTVTSFTWYHAGLVIAGPNGIVKHFKKSKDWTCDWETTPPIPIKRIESNYKDLLIGISQFGEILQYDPTENEFDFIKQHQSKFNDLCLIYPTGEYFVTLQYNRNITSWDIITGEMQDSKILKHKALAIRENPEYPYVAVGYENGVLELISIYNANAITTMASFNLSKRPLNHIYFTELGKLIVVANMDIGEFFIIEGIPGTKMEILATVEANHQICDYLLVASRTCMRLFALFVTSDHYLAGNKLVRYCIIRGSPAIECKVYLFETSYQMYTRLYATTKPNRDRVFYAIPLTTKCIHELSTKRGDPYARVISVMHTGHQMKNIVLHSDKYHTITYAYDGLVIIRTPDFTEKIAIVMPHYRTYGGVFKAYVSPLSKYVVSLGRDNALVGSIIKQVNINSEIKEELLAQLNSTKMTLMFTRPTVGFSPKGKMEGITWFEKESILQEKLEYKNSFKERNNILHEFNAIKLELMKLLTSNLEGPENEKLDIQQFNLDVSLKEEQLNNSQKECQLTKVYLEALIGGRNKVSRWIKEFCWDKMAQQGQTINAIFSNVDVTNYSLLPRNDSLLNDWHCGGVSRRLESHMAELDSFQPWIPIKENELRVHFEKPPIIAEAEKGANLDFLDDDEIQMEEELPDPDTETAFYGSTTHKFIEITPYYYTQQEITSFLQTEYLSIYCWIEISRLQENFNKKFNEFMNQKVREMSLDNERISRLRHILSELNYFSVQKIYIIIDSPEWLPLENPESVIKVEDKEVGITPYISPSAQAILDAIAAEEERIRLLLLADDFRERALMAMMNGVLEIRWEDELRKDVPKPKCMIEKLPENYNEEDIRTVMQYEADVKFLNSERERYKKMLEVEYAKIRNTLKDSIRKFNIRLDDFLLVKIKTESGVGQENMKITNTKWRSLKRLFLNTEEETTLKAIEYNKYETNAIQSLINSLQETLIELKDNLEAAQTKEKLIDKQFKKDISDSSQIAQEQAVKLFRKRPRTNLKSITSVTVILELSKCVRSCERTIILTHDCLDYLKSLDTLDLYVNVPSTVDERLYGIIIKHRRLKIENEMRIRATALDIAEAEATISSFHKLLNSKKEYGQNLLTDLDQARIDRLELFHNKEIQLVLRQGVVEVISAGYISDFKDAVMVARKDIETINKIIVKGGSRKIKAMKETMSFHRGIIAMEWQHRCLQMQIADLKTFMKDVESIKVRKEIQAYLKSKARGFSPDKGSSFEDEVEMAKESYIKTIKVKMDKIKELQKRINQIKSDSFGPGEQCLDKLINDANIDVCEYQLQRDRKLEKRDKQVVEIRMKTLVKRAELIKEIQKNYNQILLLQTELELKRQKVYPILDYKILQ